MMNGLIVIGYTGVFDSKVCESLNNVIHLDIFNDENSKCENWSAIYANQAVKIAKQGYGVCLDASEFIMDKLVDLYSKEQCRKHPRYSISTITPSRYLFEEWAKVITNMQNKRGGYDLDQSTVDRVVSKLSASSDSYQDFNNDLDMILSYTSFSHIVIPDMRYNVRDIIRGLMMMYTRRRQSYQPYQQIYQEEQDD